MSSGVSWYLRSLGNQDTHHGTLGADGIMLARCGVSFIPQPPLRVLGPPPGTLAMGPLVLKGRPPDPPDQILPGLWAWWRWCPVSGPAVIGHPLAGRAVHLLPASEVFRQGYPSTSVALCGEPVTSQPDGEVDPPYCRECVRAAIRWCAQSGAGECGHPEARADDC